MPATLATKELKIGDVARMTGLTVDTVRFYEKERLLGTIRRNAGIRCYDQDAVRRLEFVRKAAGLGFSLAEIRGLLALRHEVGKVLGDAALVHELLGRRSTLVDPNELEPAVQVRLRLQSFTNDLTVERQAPKNICG